MAYQDHRAQSRELVARCAIITLSDTRTLETDTSGKRIGELLTADGHVVAGLQILPDDPAKLRDAMTQLLSDANIDAILTNGGTGISRRDQTIPTIESLIEIPLPGFGELFRMLSWEQIASGALLSRAVGGIAKSKPIFAMPGSTKAVELAMTKLILPELRHMLFELRK
ncbi:MAG: MogA/MoaB family molybdenum cofactor biosynthesis protein [Planctomycetota bacterium]|nr:MogA/MoaB family molybdenum cofactor biosynthesis protein [Planctomycetota bacterium]